MAEHSARNVGSPDPLEQLVQVARRALIVTREPQGHAGPLRVLLDDLGEIRPRVLVIPQDETDRRQAAIGVLEVAGDLLGTALSETSAFAGPEGWPAATSAKRERLERELRTLERARDDVLGAGR